MNNKLLNEIIAVIGLGFVIAVFINVSALLISRVVKRMKK